MNFNEEIIKAMELIDEEIIAESNIDNIFFIIISPYIILG